MAGLGRLHDLRDWTYTGTYEGRHVYSVIDHVFMTADLLSEVSFKGVMDGIETGSKRHRALWFTVNVPIAVVPQSEQVELRKPAVKVCSRQAGRPSSEFEACKATYFKLCDSAVEGALSEAAELAIRQGLAITTADRISAIQRGTVQAMTRALNVHGLDSEDKVGSQASKQSTASHWSGSCIISSEQSLL